MFHIAPEDFTAEEKQVTFLANVNMACTTFNITNDQIDEVQESFEISFTVPAGIIPPSTNAMVTIFDDESKLIVFSILFEADIKINITNY